MGILWFILRVESAFFRVVAFKGFKARWLQDFITLHSQGMGQIRKHAMKRKSGKRSWKLLYLEISFSWFKVVFLMKR